MGNDGSCTPFSFISLFVVDIGQRLDLSTFCCVQVDAGMGFVMCKECLATVSSKRPFLLKSPFRWTWVSKTFRLPFGHHANSFTLFLYVIRGCKTNVKLSLRIENFAQGRCKCGRPYIELLLHLPSAAISKGVENFVQIA